MMFDLFRVRNFVFSLHVPLSMGGKDMAIWKTSRYAVVIAVIVLSMGVNLNAAQPMGVGGLTARQYIKDKVVDAMADGNISPSEYEEIFSKAQETLQPQELAGLQRTMDRLMAQMNSRPMEETVSLPPQGVGKYVSRYPVREPGVGRVFHPMPYYQPQRAPSLFAGGLSGTLGRLPYIERPEWNGLFVKQMAREFPRLNEIYPGRPTLLSSKNQGGYIVRTVPASAPQVRQVAARPNRVSASGATRSASRIQRVSATAVTPEVESPVALAPMPDDQINPPSSGGLPAARSPRRSGPDYRASRTAYLESLRNR
jgi:hypothetical protein